MTEVIRVFQVVQDDLLPEKLDWEAQQEHPEHVALWSSCAEKTAPFSNSETVVVQMGCGIPEGQVNVRLTTCGCVRELFRNAEFSSGTFAL